VKATIGAGLNLDYYTYYASGAGTLTALGERALGHIKEVSSYDPSSSDERSAKYVAQGLDTRPAIVIELLSEAIERVHTVDSSKVARALEGMTYDSFYGPVQMRADNHQLIQPLLSIPSPRWMVER